MQLNLDLKIKKHLPTFYWLLQSPFVLVITFMIFCLMAFVYSHYLGEKVGSDLARSYQRTERQTQLDLTLVSKAQTISRDEVLKNHLDAKRQNSLESGLQSYLQNGILDYLAILGPGCKTVSTVKSTKLAFVPPCDWGRLSQSDGYLEEVSQHEMPWRLVYIPITSHGRIEAYLVAARTNKTVGTSPLGQMYRHIDEKVEHSQSKSLSIAFFCFAVAFIFIFFMQFQQAQYGNMNVLGAAYLKNWLLGLFKNHHRLDLKEPSNADSKVIDFEYFRYLVQALIDEKHESNYHQSLVNQSLDDEISTLENEIAELKTQIYESGKWASTAQLSKRLCSSTVNQLCTSEEIIRTTGHQQLHELSEIANALFQQIEYWTLGVQERGARKFLRSLSEIKSSDRHSYLLDSHLANFTEWSERLVQLSQNMQIDLQQSQHRLSSLISLFKSWEAFQDSGELNLNFVQVVLRTQELLQSSTTGYGKVVFCNQIEECPNYPTETSHMISLIYLLYDYGLSCYQHVQSKVEIQTRLKIDILKKGCRATLAISFDAMDVPKTPVDLTEKERFIKVIAEKCKVNLSPLNALKTQVPIVVYWEMENLESTEGLSTILKGKSHGVEYR